MIKTSRVVIFDMHYATSEILSTLNKYLSSIIHVLLILIVKRVLEPLDIINIGFLLMWKLFELLFAFLDLKITLKLPRKEGESLFVKFRVKFQSLGHHS